LSSSARLAAPPPAVNVTAIRTRKGRSRGFCHQEAPQAHGQEEAPQAAQEDPGPAPQ